VNQLTKLAVVVGEGEEVATSTIALRLHGCLSGPRVRLLIDGEFGIVGVSGTRTRVGRF